MVQQKKEEGEGTEQVTVHTHSPILQKSLLPKVSRPVNEKRL
jgi:hypothetical protein